MNTVQLDKTNDRSSRFIGASNRWQCIPLLATTFGALACAACSSSSLPAGATEGVGRIAVHLTLKGADDDARRDGGAPPRGVPVIEAGGAELVVEEAVAYVRRVDFEYPRDSSCRAEADAGRYCDDEIRVDGPWVVDLMTGSATPELPDVQVPAGTYRRVDVRFDDADDDSRNVPAELAGYTIVASGRYSGAGAERFQLQLKFDEDARFESPDGIEVSADGVSQALLELDVQRWFSSVDLSECLADGDLAVRDGVVRIDEDGDCSDVENQLRDAIKGSARLGHD